MHCLGEFHTRSDAESVYSALQGKVEMAFDKNVENCKGLTCEYYTPPKSTPEDDKVVEKREAPSKSHKPEPKKRGPPTSGDLRDKINSRKRSRSPPHKRSKSPARKTRRSPERRDPPKRRLSPPRRRSPPRSRSPIRRHGSAPKRSELKSLTRTVRQSPPRRTIQNNGAGPPPVRPRFDSATAPSRRGPPARGPPPRNAGPPHRPPQADPRADEARIGRSHIVYEIISALENA